MTGRDERNQGTQARSSNHEGGRTLKKRLGVLSVVTILVMAFFALSAVASSSEMYFSSDKNGQNRVTNIQEGSSVFVVIYDPDENIDCDVRDKIWTDIKIMDPKTGAYIVWISVSPEDEDPEEGGWPAAYMDPPWIEGMGLSRGNGRGHGFVRVEASVHGGRAR
jgi:hypothetical protein